MTEQVEYHDVALRRRHGRYVLDFPYDPALVQFAKQAGFRWDPSNKEWWTTDESKAAKLLNYADDFARAGLEEAAEQLKASLAASRATDSDVEIPAPEGLQYYPFQRAGVAFAAKRRATIIGDEMGLGKTVQAVGVMNLDHIDRALIVCPASLKYNWRRELRRWLTHRLRIGIAEGRYWPPTADVVIVNYDILRRHHHRLTGETWPLVVLDEVHYLKNPKAQRTQAVFGQDKWDRNERRWVWLKEPIRADRVIGLTGTPIVNRPAELWPILHYMDRDRWQSWWGYARRYCNAFQRRVGRKQFWDFSGASHLDELQEKLRSTILVRRLKRDVLTELPPKRRQIIELPADAAQNELAAEIQAWRAHREKLRKLRAAVEVAKASDDPADYEKAVAKLSEGMKTAFEEISALRRATAVAKTPLVVEHIRDVLEAEDKLLVFGHHHQVLDALLEAFGGEAVMLSGRQDKDQRQRAVDRFQNDPNVRVFVGSIQAAGVGLTLTAAAHVIFAELDWVPGNVTQAEDRAHRIGQADSVLVQHLVLEGSLDATMARTLVAKQDVIDRALDEGSGASFELKAPVVPEDKEERAATTSATRKSIEQDAAKLTPENIDAIHSGLKQLAGVCDRAQALDDAGFSKLDAAIGHSLAAVDRLTPKQAALGQKLVRKYRRQLGKTLLAQAGVKA